MDLCPLATHPFAPPQSIPLPSTWRAYGMGGDIDDPRDAILAAVRAIRRFAGRTRADARTFLSYYAWQVFVRTPTGVRRVTGPGRG